MLAMKMMLDLLASTTHPLPHPPPPSAPAAASNPRIAFTRDPPRRSGSDGGGERESVDDRDSIHAQGGLEGGSWHGEESGIFRK